MGEVPVLTDEDKHISQSGVILQYLSLKTGMYRGKEFLKVSDKI